MQKKLTLTEMNKDKFNQKFGPVNNPNTDHFVFQSISNERKKKNSRFPWFKWAIGLTAAASITFCTLNLTHKTDYSRESYIQSVLEVQKSFDDNANREISNEINDLTIMTTDEI
jgi:hypothetical protein